MVCLCTLVQDYLILNLDSIELEHENLNQDNIQGDIMSVNMIRLSPNDSSHLSKVLDYRRKCKHMFSIGSRMRTALEKNFTISCP
jgi:hypothetical protein